MVFPPGNGPVSVSVRVAAQISKMPPFPKIFSRPTASSNFFILFFACLSFNSLIIRTNSLIFPLGEGIDIQITVFRKYRKDLKKFAVYIEKLRILWYAYINTGLTERK